MARKVAPRADSVSIVYDADGVAINDITPMIEERFPPKGHGAVRRVYIEVVYNLLRPFRETIARKLASGEKSPPVIDASAAAGMRRAQDNGDNVIMCTRNPLLYSHRMARMLEAAGLNDVERGREVGIRTAFSKSKVKIMPVDVAVMNEDDSIESLHFARAGIDAVLIPTDYNRILGWFFSRVNGRVHSLRHGDEAERVTRPIVERRRAEIYGAGPQPH